MFAYPKGVDGKKPFVPRAWLRDYNRSDVDANNGPVGHMITVVTLLDEEEKAETKESLWCIDMCSAQFGVTQRDVKVLLSSLVALEE